MHKYGQHTTQLLISKGFYVNIKVYLVLFCYKTQEYLPALYGGDAVEEKVDWNC